MALRPISIDAMDNFQLDDDDRLYWKEKAVILEKRVRLENYQIALASLATAGAVLSGVHPYGHALGWW